MFTNKHSSLKRSLLLQLSVIGLIATAILLVISLYFATNFELSKLSTEIIKSNVIFFILDVLLVVILIYFTYRLLDKHLFAHLDDMAQFMTDVDVNKPHQAFTLKRNKKHGNADELDQLVKAFNDERAELAKSHRQLVLSQDKFFKIFDSSPDAILITSFETGIILDVNKSFYRLYEFEESDNVIGKNARELGLWVNTENREEWKKFLEKQGPIYLRETKYRKKTGNTSDCIASMQVIDFGNMLGLVTTIRDISETKRYQEELLQSRRRLHNLAKSQEEIRENERIGIAREIHDELGQSFTGLKIDLYWLQEYLTENDSLQKKVNTMIEDIDRSVDTVRRISSELRPSVLDDLGLEAAIEWYTNDFTKRTRINHELHMNCEDLSHIQHRDTAVFRIYQEALTNIARHSQADHFIVDMLLEENKIVLSIQDNGIGITQDQLQSDNSIGIIGMQERAANIGADVEICNRKDGDSGTIVTLTCPLIGIGIMQ